MGNFDKGLRGVGWMPLILLLVTLGSVAGIRRQTPLHVGDKTLNGTVIPVGAPVDPQGKTVYMADRPIQTVLLKDGSGVVVLTNDGISIYDLPGLQLRQTLSMTGGTSMCGLAVSHDGKWVAASGAHSTVFVAELKNENLTWAKKIVLPTPAAKGDAYPCGLAWSRNDQDLVVCASRSNELLEYKTTHWVVEKTIAVDPAPFEVKFGDENHVYVSCWSSKPKDREPIADASGTMAPVDSRGIVKQASVDSVDLRNGNVKTMEAGRQPANLISVKSQTVVPCADDDSLWTYPASRGANSRRYDLSSRFGKMCSPTWVDYSVRSGELAVCLGRSNRLAIYSGNPSEPRLKQVFRTNWYPACVVAGEKGWIVSCAEGDGSRSGINGAAKRNVYDFHGSLSYIPFDSTPTSILKPEVALKPRPGIAPVPIPERPGEPSVFKHVVYILKENRTYDQVFGDMPEGDGSKELCDYPRKVTPNHHKLAEEFVLLDNYYCNGILSADGHAWAMEGNATSYFERTFGGFTRSYPFGDDPLSVSKTGFIWNDALEHGRSFRNYGEFDYASVKPNDGWVSLYRDLDLKRHQISQNIGVASLKPYTRAGFPGWDLGIPDQLRANVFLSDLQSGPALADLTLVYLPQDHTSGDAKGAPTPASCLADNDLALGRVIDGISHSRYWKDTCVFVNEDDPQAGYDHIDGHRSLCLVVSPYTSRKRVISRFYNQTSVLRSMERILGIPPMNLNDAESPLMTACFDRVPDFTPYQAIANETPLDQLNGGSDHHLRFEKPDLNEDLLFNQVLWHAAHPARPYPAHLPSRLAERGLASQHAESDDDD